MSKTEKAIESLNTAKLILCNQQMLTPEICIKIGQTVTDAIALLKEQEPVEPKRKDISHNNIDWFCGKCGHCVRRLDNYCSRCGRKVKWNE